MAGSDEQEEPLLPTHHSPPPSRSSRRGVLTGKRKDKGKQKVRTDDDGVFIDPTTHQQHDDDNGPLVNYVVKFSDNTMEDLKFSLPSGKTTVEELRDEIRTQTVTTRNRRLRLIHSGRLLGHDTNLQKDVVDKVHVPVEGGVTKTVYIHCSIGNEMSEAELAQEAELDDRNPQRTTLPELRGFDILRETGFTEQDIATLRGQFNNIYGTMSDEQRQELEEQWIEGGARNRTAMEGRQIGEDNADGLIDLFEGYMNPLSLWRVEDPNDVVVSPDTYQPGTYVDDLIGVMIGFFCGFVSLLLIGASALFNRRQRRAIFAGFLCNIFFAFMRADLN